MLKISLAISLITVFIGCSSVQPKSTSSKCEKIASELNNLKNKKYSEYVAMIVTTSYAHAESETHLKEKIKVLEMKLKMCRE